MLELKADSETFFKWRFIPDDDFVMQLALALRKPVFIATAPRMYRDSKGQRILCEIADEPSNVTFDYHRMVKEQEATGIWGPEAAPSWLIDLETALINELVFKYRNVDCDVVCVMEFVMRGPVLDGSSVPKMSLAVRSGSTKVGT
jgi:hypothetical protein